MTSGMTRWSGFAAAGLSGAVTTGASAPEAEGRGGGGRDRVVAWNDVKLASTGEKRR